MEVKIDTTVFIQTPYGPAEVISFTGFEDGKDHIVFAFGNWRAQAAPKVRMHSECLTGDVFGSLRCDCGSQLKEALSLFAKTGGLLLYLRQEGRGIGLLNKLRAYRLQDEGYDTYAANERLGFKKDERDFKVAAEMLKALGIAQVRLLSNNPRKARQLEENGIRVSHRIYTRTYVCAHNERYLKAKAEVGGHDGLRFTEFAEAVK
jgi:GTP cyclohydrolase II